MMSSTGGSGTMTFQGFLTLLKSINCLSPPSVRTVPRLPALSQASPRKHIFGSPNFQQGPP